MTLPRSSLKCERERREAAETSICFTEILINAAWREHGGVLNMLLFTQASLI